jgi:hypothetical protein
MIQQQEQALLDAMQYMTKEERAVLVALAQSYADERMNLPARFFLASDRRQP